MDKKRLLRNSLAKIMVDEISLINDLLRQNPTPEITLKDDGSPVTKLDLALSEHIESLMEKNFPDTTFYSEENFSDWSFPLLALDPLDGTREYIDGRAEWAVSIGIFQSEKFEGEGWVYNPVTEEVFSIASNKSFQKKETYCGEVSRSEWKQGLFTQIESKRFSLIPMGSIAYKLGRLSAGKCDYVVSLRPKNIWDIAGGTILANQAGFKFYSEGREVKRVQKEYLPPLIWCHEGIFSELSELYPLMDKYH